MLPHIDRNGYIQAHRRLHQGRSNQVRSLHPHKRDGITYSFYTWKCRDKWMDCPVQSVRVYR